MAANTAKRITYNIEVNDKGKYKVEGLTKGFVTLDNAVKKVNTDLIQQGQILDKNSKKTKNMIDKTGLAGAAMIEVGRTISDSNYGMRAMANNISQLSTLMITLMMTSGGLVGGIKQLLKVAFGPVGLIVAFQILIARMEKAAMAADSFKREANAMGDAIGKAGADLVTFLRAVDRGNISQEEMADTIEQLKNNYKDLNIELTDEGVLTEASRLVIEDKIKSLVRLAKAQAIQLEIQKTYQDQLQAQIIRDEDLLTVGDRESTGKQTADFFKFAFDQAEKTVIKGRESLLPTIGGAIKMTQTMLRMSRGQFTEEEAKAYKAWQKTEKTRRTDEINAVFAASTKEREIKIAGWMKELEEKGLFNEAFAGSGLTAEEDALKKLAALRAKYAQKAKEAATKSKSELLIVQRNAAIEMAEELVAKLPEGSPVIDYFKEIIDYFNIVIAKAEEAEDAIDRATIRDKQLEDLKLVMDAQKQIFDTAKRFITELSQLQSQSFAAQEKRLDNERQIILHNDSLTSKEKNRLLIENDKKTRAIQTKKIKFDRDIFIIEQGMELTKIALKIKNAITDLNIKAADSGGAAVMSIGEFMRQLGPLGIAAYAVSIGAVIAAIISAKNKAKQQMAALAGATAGVSSSGGGQGSAPSIQAPSFNVVGATQTSQLAQTIAGAEEQPLRAYVVASDISTAQELERSTIEGSSMG